MTTRWLMVTGVVMLCLALVMGMSRSSALLFAFAF
jgi:hypothetical protein